MASMKLRETTKKRIKTGRVSPRNRLGLWIGRENYFYNTDNRNNGGTYHSSKIEISKMSNRQRNWVRNVYSGTFPRACKHRRVSKRFFRRLFLDIIRHRVNDFVGQCSYRAETVRLEFGHRLEDPDRPGDVAFAGNQSASITTTAT